MSRTVLNMDAVQEDFFFGTEMIGIGAAMPAYNFCWLLNERLDMNFMRDPDEVITMKKKGIEYTLPIYYFDHPNCNDKYLLYKLKNGTESLLPETRLLDYVWLVQTENAEEDALRIAAQLRALPGVQFAQLLPAEQLKNIRNLLV